jgi:hypothetical protein
MSATALLPRITSMFSSFVSVEAAEKSADPTITTGSSPSGSINMYVVCT